MATLRGDHCHLVVDLDGLYQTIFKAFCGPGIRGGLTLGLSPMEYSVLSQTDRKHLQNACIRIVRLEYPTRDEIVTAMAELGEIMRRCVPSDQPVREEVPHNLGYAANSSDERGMARG